MKKTNSTCKLMLYITTHFYITDLRVFFYKFFLFNKKGET